MQALDRCLVISPSFERRIEHRPPGTEKPGQTMFRETQVQTVKAFPAFETRLLVTANDKSSLPYLPGTGDPGKTIELCDPFEWSNIQNPEEQEGLNVFLEAQ